MQIQAVLFICLLFAGIAEAKENIQVSEAWVRATMPGQEVSGAFFSVKSLRPAKLIKVESSIADSVEIHSMTMKNGVMEMRELKTLALPAGKFVKLAPGDRSLTRRSSMPTICSRSLKSMTTPGRTSSDSTMADSSSRR